MCFHETVWMTQIARAELYQSTKQNISHHIKNIFEEKELDENAVVKFYLTTAMDGKNYKTKHYNLENSKRKPSNRLPFK